MDILSESQGTNKEYTQTSADNFVALNSIRRAERRKRKHQHTESEEMLAVISQTQFFHLSSKITYTRNQYESPSLRCGVPVRKCRCLNAVLFVQQVYQRSSFGLSRTHKRPFSQAVSSAMEDTQVLPSQSHKFSVSTCGTDKPNELKINVDVSGTRTQAVFDDVFCKLVADAQPIPGFRRVKGGKTPNIPKDVLLEILGPSKVYKQVIKQVINSTISEYIKKEGWNVSNDLQVHQSFEDLEAVFEPGEEFRFEAILLRED